MFKRQTDQLKAIRLSCFTIARRCTYVLFHYNINAYEFQVLILKKKEYNYFFICEM